MNIKRLRIVGFKSFCNETEVSFHKGINAIVGPNGCGKSNISDALKWVMGEHNVRNLRGERFEDIIFGGSREAKPLGMAEVTMTVENDGRGMAPQYADFAEIEITRRVYRSGESEYLINKQPCLLKDIKEIFMDTGLNPRAYSIIEQGAIMDIVNSSPQELRRMLEEAAGITKYRERKATTIRKIEATRENLARVADIILEVDKQSRTVSRQANEARRYTIFQRELTRMEAALYHRRHDELRGLWEQAAARQASLGDQVEGVRAGVAAAEARIEEGRLGVLGVERDLSSAQESFYRVSGRLEVAETQIGHLKERLEDHREGLTRATAGLAELSGRRERARACLGEAETALAAVGAGLASTEEALEACRLEEAAGEERLSEVRSRHDGSRRDLGRVLQEKRALLETVAGTEARLQGDEALLVHLGEESARLASAGERLCGERGDVARRREAVAADAEEASAALALAAAEIAAAEQSHRELASGLEESARRLAEGESRLASLRDIQRRGDNLKESARRLYTLARETGADDGSFVGVLGHLLHVDHDHRRAIEAALADRLEAVLVRDDAAAQSLAARLAGEGAGGATVVAPSGWAAPESADGHGTLGPASNYVRAEGDAGSLVRSLLAGVYVVRDLDEALALRRAGGGVTYCTLDGHLVHPWGGVTVGGPSGQGVLAVAEEVERLAAETARLRDEVGTLRGRVEAERSRIEALRVARNERERSRSELAGSQAGLDSQLAGLEKELRDTASRRESLERDLATRRDTRQREQASLDEYRRRLGELEAEEVRLSAEVEHLESEQSGAEEGRASIRARAAELEVARAAAQEKRRGHEEAIASLRREEEDLAARAKELEAARVDLEGRIVEAREGVATQEALREELAGVRAGHAAEVEKLQVRHRELSAAAAARAEELKELRARWEGLSGELSEAAASVAELRAHLEETAARALSETGYDFSAEKSAELADHLARPAEELTAKAQRLKARIARIGPVNMAALDEVDALKERLAFLTGQKADLEQALESLQEAIRKINKTSREKFAETFEQVGEQFAETFRALFNGGEAVLQLEEGVDLLEAGIHIYAQPPGKKMTKLNLLSGGEKAMTALGLLFALFFVRPAPFCLMDEVDAPLDEVNVERFVRLIAERINGSQIVLITHNKRTMERADNLVGVTMESPGVSKLVSVRLTSNN